MNFTLKHPGKGDFYLLGITMTTDGDYAVSAVYLNPDGSVRTYGCIETFTTKQAAIKHCKGSMRIKKKKKGYRRCSLLDIPKQGHASLKPDIDSYMKPEDMLALMEEARSEYYVEFGCVTGLEEQFDEAVEYLAFRDDEDPDFYDVYDRFGKLCQCHESRFSRCEPTERALEVAQLSKPGDRDYVCAYCKDSTYGCANCTS